MLARSSVADGNEPWTANGAIKIKPTRVLRQASDVRVPPTVPVGNDLGKPTAFDRF